MSEKKRATLMSFGADKGDEKKEKVPAKSVRLTLVLPESNESTCPVYNYKEELAAAKKRESKVKNGGKSTNGLDPFDEDDDDVKRIAMEMEAKYGAGPPAKKRSKGRRDDYADIGMGYDESDSFIDNTDGYDEIIPQNVTTLHGGFYINCGALEFKTDEAVSSENSSSSSSSSDEDDDEENQEKTSRKRVLESSDSEGDTETENGKDVERPSNAEKRPKVQENMVNGAVKKKIPDENQNKVNKKPQTQSEEIKKKTVKELLKEKREEANGNSRESDSSLKQSDTNDKVDNTMKENKKPQQDSLNDIINLVVKGNEKQIAEKMAESKSSNGKPIPTLLSADGENSRESNPEKTQPIVDLPENLPENILSLVKQIKQAVIKSTENNGKVFCDSVNNLLISFERKSKVLGRMSRSKIYQHLAPFMKCKKESLLRRAKALVIAEDTRKLKILTSDLKSKISAAMSGLLDAYEKEAHRISQLKELETDENKTLRMPKRKFVWTDEIKKLLKEVIFVKKRLLILEGKTKEHMEISLNLYIKSDIQVLWPEGWMTMAALLKLCTTFGEKKPGSINASTTDANLPKPVQKPKDTAVVKDKELVTQKVTTKESQKSAPKPAVPQFSSNTLSITPITSSTATNLADQSTSKSFPSVPKEGLTINRVENDRVPLPVVDIGQKCALSISPVSSDLKKERSPTPTTTANIAKHNPKQQQETHTEKKLSAAQPAELMAKPTKPPTDHKIENIIKQSLMKATTEKAQPMIKAKPIAELTKKPKVEVVLPRPIKDIKKEDDVICIDDSIPVVATNHQRIKPSNEEKRIKPPKAKSKHEMPLKVSTTSKSEANKLLGRHLAGPGMSGLFKTNGILLGDTLIDNLLQETLAKSEDYYNNKKRSDPNQPGRNSATAVGGNTQGNKSLEGDDIQQVMENLKVLQKMSTPTKSNETASNSSAVSVIAFNKSYNPKSTTPTSNAAVKSAPGGMDAQKKAHDYSPMGFQDVYQREFLSDLKTTFGSTPSKFNTTTAHSSTSQQSQQEKYYTNANNNYTQQSSQKYKNSYSNQGSFNLMDDMLANLISEYAYPKTANHKSKPPPK